MDTHVGEFILIVKVPADLKVIKTSYATLIHYCNSFCLATTKMIDSHSVVSGKDHIMLKWRRPRFQPERYQLTYKCTMNTTSKPSQDTNHSINAKTQNVSSNITSFTISGLLPSSIYLLILLAVYNPASIDTGIAITATTLSATWKIYTGLYSFIITFVMVVFVILLIHVSITGVGKINLIKSNLSFLMKSGNEERV